MCVGGCGEETGLRSAAGVSSKLQRKCKQDEQKIREYGPQNWACLEPSRNVQYTSSDSGTSVHKRSRQKPQYELGRSIDKKIEEKNRYEVRSAALRY
jgi:hypothetical protein